MMTAGLLHGVVLAGGALLAEAPPCFPPQAGLDEFRVEWYCGHLTAAGVRELAGDPAYRFVYLPSFHAPRIVTVLVEAGAPVVRGIVLSGKGGYKPGNVQRRTERRLSDREWRLLRQRLENAGMWEGDTRQQDTGFDGSRWILEGRADGKYRFHDIWSPKPSRFPQYYKACSYMLELAGLTPAPPEELY